MGVHRALTYMQQANRLAGTGGYCGVREKAE